MDNVGMQSPDFQKGEEGVDSGFEALAAWRVDREQTDALIRVGMTGSEIRRAADDGDIMTHSGQTRVEFLTVGLDTALDVGDSAGADNCDLHDGYLRGLRSP